jgi:hypothetical protein
MMEAPGPDPGFWKGVIYAMMFTAVIVIVLWMVFR